MNQYPLWKNLLVAVVVLLGALFALPNVFDQDPSMQVLAQRDAVIDQTTRTKVEEALSSAGVAAKRIEIEEGKMLVRFASSEEQLKAVDPIAAALGDDYTEALTLSPDLPAWLRRVAPEPMYLGLDLRGGVHVLIDVDMETAVEQALERYSNDIRTLLRENKVRYTRIGREGDAVEVKFNDAAKRDNAEKIIYEEFRTLVLANVDQGDNFLVTAKLAPSEIREVRQFALKQNITTLRNRINALGVAEPLIQQQGDRRIVVQLPGAQDPAKLKEILGATATLEYRLADTEHSVLDAENGRVPPGSRLYHERNGNPVLLKKQVIVTGDQITDAKSGFDPQSGQPAVTVTLDGIGAKRMRRMTNENVGNPMAVVFIENRPTTRMVDGKPKKVKNKVEEVISVATIREPFGKRFQTTGLDSPAEAHDLALLLRAGALAAPIEIVEERTIGPSLGQDNIDQGFLSVVIGMALVILFMAVYYRVFGLVAAFSTIIDANITTLIAAVVLYSFGTGPIKGFAVTLGLGILTSMFTAIIGTRAVINLIYGHRRVKALSV
ncbi:MAG: protein translocase subunit SecD [Candidatus Thiodiazotropha sp.]